MFPSGGFSRECRERTAADLYIFSLIVRYVVRAAERGYKGAGRVVHSGGIGGP